MLIERVWRTECSWTGDHLLRYYFVFLFSSPWRIFPPSSQEGSQSRSLLAPLNQSHPYNPRESAWVPLVTWVWLSGIGLQGLGEVALSKKGREEEFGRAFSESKKGRTEGFYGFQKNELEGLLMDWEERVLTPGRKTLYLSNDLLCSSLIPRQHKCHLQGRLGQWT